MWPMPCPPDMGRSGSDLDVLHGDGVHHGPAVLAMAVAAGEALGFFQRVKDLGPCPAAVGVEVGNVKFLYCLVFHESSLQPGSDILWNRLRVLLLWDLDPRRGPAASAAGLVQMNPSGGIWTRVSGGWFRETLASPRLWSLAEWGNQVSVFHAAGEFPVDLGKQGPYRCQVRSRLVLLQGALEAKKV